MKYAHLPLDRQCRWLLVGVELMSESNRLVPLQEKMEEWIENGCRLAWLIAPRWRWPGSTVLGSGRARSRLVRC